MEHYVLDDIAKEFTQMIPMHGSIACKVRDPHESSLAEDDSTAALARIRHLLRYKFLSLLSYDKRVLDCGCGCGYGTYILSKNAKEVVGIDLDSDLIKFAKTYHKTSNTCFFLSDIESFNDGAFDLVVSVETFEHISPDKIDLFISGMKSMVKSGGLIVITTPRVEKSRDYSEGINFKRLHSHYKEYSKEDFLDVLTRNGLSVEQYLLQGIDGNIIYQIPKKVKFYDMKSWVQIAICRKD